MRAISLPAEQRPVKSGTKSGTRAGFEPSQLRARLRHALPSLEPDLHVIAEALPVRDGSIDLLAQNGQGELVIVLIAGKDDRDEAALLFVRAVATRDWLAADLPGWLQLLPDLEIGPTTPVRCLLLARHFDQTTRAAAAALPAKWLDLAIYRPFEHAGDTYLLLEHAPEVRNEPVTEGAQASRGPAPTALRPSPKAPTRQSPAPTLRSGLSDSDFKLSHAERSALDQGESPRPRYSADHRRRSRPDPLRESD